MRLADDVLVEIVDIVRHGLMSNSDVSSMLRRLELEPDDTAGVVRIASTYRREPSREIDDSSSC